MTISTKIDPANDPDWCERACERIAADGYAIISGMLSPDEIDAHRAAVDRLPDKIVAAVGRDRFEATRAAGFDELRLPFLLEPVLFDILAHRHMLAMADRLLGPAATLRFFHAVITPPATASTLPRNTDSFHQNFKIPLRADGGKPLLLDMVFALSETISSLRVVPGSQNLAPPQAETVLESRSVTLDLGMGDMVAMNPFLWHREDANRQDGDEVCLVLQFSRPFIKPHADYMRAIDADTLARLPERTRQLLGAYTQLPVSLTEFYLPEQLRPYRPGQW